MPGEEKMPSAAPISILDPFQQQLVGDWKNQDFRLDNQGIPVGGDENPLSYNLTCNTVTYCD
jgi:hypothetical protein